MSLKATISKNDISNSNTKNKKLLKKVTIRMKNKQRFLFELEIKIISFIQKSRFFKKIIANPCKGYKEYILIAWFLNQANRFYSTKKEAYSLPSLRTLLKAIKRAENIDISYEWINQVLHKYENKLWTLQFNQKFKSRSLALIGAQSSFVDFKTSELFIFKTKKYTQLINSKTSNKASSNNIVDDIWGD